jgi:hypothetical protein
MTVPEDWREPLAPDPVAAPGRARARPQDVQWARTYGAPWLVRRLRGVSSGDGLDPKRPTLQSL